MTEGGAQMDQEGALALSAAFKPRWQAGKLERVYSGIWSFGEIQVTASPQADR